MGFFNLRFFGHFYGLEFSSSQQNQTQEKIGDQKKNKKHTEWEVVILI
jgi:hypothetical protein